MGTILTHRRIKDVKLNGTVHGLLGLYIVNVIAWPYFLGYDDYELAQRERAALRRLDRVIRKMRQRK